MNNGPTKYELRAIAPDGTAYLAGYCRIPSQSSAIRMIRQHREAWLELWGNAPTTWAGKGRMGWKLECNGWVVSFSGRTKLEASRSELPWFKSFLARI